MGCASGPKSLPKSTPNSSFTTFSKSSFLETSTHVFQYVQRICDMHEFGYNRLFIHKLMVPHSAPGANNLVPLAPCLRGARVMSRRPPPTQNTEILNPCQIPTWHPESKVCLKYAEMSAEAILDALQNVLWAFHACFWPWHVGGLLSDLFQKW